MCSHRLWTALVGLWASGRGASGAGLSPLSWSECAIEADACLSTAVRQCGEVVGTSGPHSIILRGLGAPAGS